MDWLKQLNQKLDATRDQKFRSTKQGHIDVANASYYRHQSSKDCYLIRFPGKDLIKLYDREYKNNKYLPSHIYKIRYSIGYDTDKIIEYVKTKLGYKIDMVEAILVYKMYPWLTDQPSKFILFETMKDLTKQMGIGVIGLVMKTDPRHKLDYTGCYIEKYIRKNINELDDHPQRMLDVKDIRINTEEDVLKMRDAELECKEIKSLKGIVRYTETCVEVNEFGDVKTFETKTQALNYLSKYITDAGYVVKADRITQILKDGCIAIFENGGSGAGKGGKIKVDAFPGLTARVAHIDNGYKIKHIVYRRTDKKYTDLCKRIDRYVAENKLVVKNTYFKQR